MMTKSQGIIKICIPSQLGFENIAMDAVASLARLMKFSDKRIESLKLAVSEACINAIEHGNKLDANVEVMVDLIADDSKLQVEVYDQGMGVHCNIEKPDIHAKVDGSQEPRGWGLFLIQTLMNETEFEWNPKTGNVVRMTIYLDRNRNNL